MSDDREARTVEEVLTAYDLLGDVPAPQMFTRFDVDARAIIRHATERATTIMQEINLGANPLLAVGSSFTHGVLLGLAIAEQRGAAVDRLIEEAS